MNIVTRGTLDSYIHRIGSTFHYRRRVPVDVQPQVGKKFWKVSLRTTSERDASIAARELAVKHQRVIDQARGLSLADQHAEAETMLQFAREAILDAPMGSKQQNEAEALHRLTREAVEKLNRAMLAAAEQRLDTLPIEERRAIQKLGGVEKLRRQTDRDSNELDWDRLQLPLWEMSGSITPREAEVEAARLQIRAQHVIKDEATLLRLGLASEDSGWDDPKNPRIKTAMVKWFAERKQGPTAINRHRVAIRRFIEMHGNLPVLDITKTLVRDYVKRIECLSDHRRLPTTDRGGLAQGGDDVPRVASSTVARHLISIKAFLTFCVEQNWITINAATGLRPPKDMRPKASKRRSFTREERNTILARAVEEHGENGDMAWLVRLVAYTGCRLEEIAQLARSNVCQVDGIWIVEIDDLDGRNVKTASSVKQIPLHPAIRAAFVAWVVNGKGDRVFASFSRRGSRFANKLSGDFARLMDRAGLTDPRLVFHSMRHTLKREMSNAGVDADVRRIVLGHSPKDPHDGYDAHSLSAIAKELEKLPQLFD